MTNFTVPGASILTMPLPDSKAAPEKFKGRYSKIQPFLNHFEMLLAQNNVALDKDKCELVTWYCSLQVGEFIQALTSFMNKDWEGLKKDLLKYYGADLAVTKYRVKDLVRLTDIYRAKKLRTQRAWREYGREFITIAGWLKKNGRITQEEYAGFYWRGIPPRIAEKAEDRLLAMDTAHSLSTPFGVRDVNEVVENLLKRDRFDAHLPGTHDDEESEMDQGNEDDSDDESDSVRRNHRRLKKKARVAREKIGKYDSDSDTDDNLPFRQRTSRNTRAKKEETNEIEGMIKQLNAMSINDTRRAGIVLQALKEDPGILNLIPGGGYASKVQDSNSQPSTRNPTLFNHQTPPHLSPNYPAQPQSFNPRNRFSNPGYACYGCGNPDHRMNECPELDELVRRGTIWKDQRGRFVHASGMSIRRVEGEPMTVTVHRDLAMKESEITPTSHLIRILEASESEDESQNTYFYQHESHGYTSDDEELDKSFYAALKELEDDSDDDEEFKSYPVTRSQRAMASQNRRQVTESILMPTRRRNEKTAPRTIGGPKNGEREKGRKKVEVSTAPPEVQVPVPVPRSVSVAPPTPDSARKQTQVPGNKEPIPVETRRPEYDGSRDDVIMEDAEQEKRHSRSARPGNESRAVPPDSTRLANLNTERTMEMKRPGAARRSEIAFHSNPLAILNQIFNEGITVRIGDLFGLSKELSGHMIDKIKPKPTRLLKPPQSDPPMVNRITGTPTARPIYSPERGVLIELHMQCDNRPITAIIDTGLQLNIASREVCDQIIRRPVDSLQETKMGDANGGSGKLIG